MPPRDPPREPPFFEALDRELLDPDRLEPELPRFMLLFFAPPRFIPDRLALPFFAVLFFALLRFEALFRAPPFFAAPFRAPLFFAAPFLPPERLLIAGPRRVLFFPALRFVPRPDFFVAIAASPPPEVIVGTMDATVLRESCVALRKFRANHAPRTRTTWQMVMS